MAALRVAARRLVGGGQTPAVAVEATQRRLFPRFFQAGRARSTASSAAAAADANVAAGKACEDPGKLLTEIHNMREELYHKVSYAARTYDIPGKEGKNISRLRQELAAQVDYRPGDNTWHMLRAISMFQRYGGYVAGTFTTYVLTGMATGWIVELEPDEKRCINKKRGAARKQSETK